MMQQSDDVSTGNPKSIKIAAVAQERASFSASADFTNSLERQIWVESRSDPQTGE